MNYSALAGELPQLDWPLAFKTNYHHVILGRSKLRKEGQRLLRYTMVVHAVHAIHVCVHAPLKIRCYKIASES